MTTSKPTLGRQGVWVLVGSLSVLFAAGIALFVIARTGAGSHNVRDSIAGPRLALPVWLWVSSLFLFASSVVLHQGRQWIGLGLARRGLFGFRWAMALGVVFAVLQVPGLVALSGRYHPAAGGTSPVYFVVLALVALHALHAAGGLVPGAVIAWRLRPDDVAAWGRERIDVFAIYWHFVVGVWLVLFSTFSLV